MFRGDIVTLQNPLAPAGASALLVRRLVALPGDEMVSDSPDDAPFVLPPGTCWVERDNEEVPLDAAPDSRAFGPLPLRALAGRVLYAVRGRGDHGPVTNSISALEQDWPVLEAELDVDELTK